MHWVIQETDHEAGMVELKHVLDRGGIPYSLHKVIPYIGEIIPDISPEGNVIVIGSYSLRHVAKRKGWEPGSFDLGELTYADHCKEWGADMLNYCGIVCQFKHAIDYIDGIIPDKFFVRPIHDSKFFAGEVTTRTKFVEWWSKVIVLPEDDKFSLRGSTEIMISPVINILREYRIWVVDGKVVTASLYKSGGTVHYSSDVDDDIISFAQRKVDMWQPARAFVMDIALIDDNVKKIIETNTLNAAGFYAANIGKLVDAIENMSY